MIFKYLLLTYSASSETLVILFICKVHAACVYFRYVVAAVVASRVPRPPQHRSATITL